LCSFWFFFYLRFLLLEKKTRKGGLGCQSLRWAAGRNRCSAAILLFVVLFVVDFGDIRLIYGL
jgi:hypothetical protein